MLSKPTANFHAVHERCVGKKNSPAKFIFAIPLKLSVECFHLNIITLGQNDRLDLLEVAENKYFSSLNNVSEEWNRAFILIIESGYV